MNHLHTLQYYTAENSNAKKQKGNLKSKIKKSSY